MGDADSTIAVYGTSQPPDALRRVTVGPLSFLYSTDGLRRISWHGTEVVRAIAWPMRDENWGTYAATVLTETLEVGDAAATGRLTISVADGRLHCELRFRADRAGSLHLTLDMAPQGGAFRTNRSGFTVLHPIQGVAGSPLRVTHSTGAVEDTVFPALISPGQPVMDISGLRHDLGGCTIDIAFDGEVFEMEDQRNWSDASYKTYCVPLVVPFGYDIAAPTRQSITVTLDGGSTAAASAAAEGIAFTTAEGAAPRIGLAVEPGWLPAAAARETVAALGASDLLVRLTPGADASYLSGVRRLADALGAEIAAEIVLEPDDVPGGLAGAAQALATAGIAPARVLALTEGYLASHQPVGPWPAGPDPVAVCAAVRTVFPDAETGGGMMTSFTEFNRCRPDPAVCDYVTHGNTAIVHAGDDLSVIETLETLPQIFASAEALSGGKPYRLGLVSIGMRSNPYGAAVADNPGQIRQTMAKIDPRHRGLFGAAWAVGVLAATEGSRLASLCLGAPVGPFGLAYAPQDYPQEGYDPGTARVAPVYHVARAACAMAGRPRIRLTGLPPGVHGYAVSDAGRMQALIANVSDAPAALRLPASGQVALLDAESFGAAIATPDWVESAKISQGPDLALAPFATAFARFAAP